MPHDSTSLSRHQVYDHHHRDESYWTGLPETSEPIEFVTTPPVYKGRFKRGFDPRRHQFTDAERSKGFWTAIAILGIGIGQKLHATGRWPNYRGR